MARLLLLLVALFGIAAPAGADSFVEWNPSLDVVADAPWRLPVEPVVLDAPRVVVKDGHFSLGGRRYRAWGVNLSFGAKYSTMLEEQFAGWLRRRYDDEAGLRRAWNVRNEPLGDDLLAPVAADNRWMVEQHQGARVKRTEIKRDGGAGVRLEPERITGTGWHLQYNLRPLALEQGRYYTLSCKARADRPRTIQAAVTMAHEPWESLGLSLPLKLGAEWSTHRVGFVARNKDDNARVTFSFGGGPEPIELVGVRLQRGGMIGLGKGESLAEGRVALWGASETPERSNDRVRFLVDTEKRFFDGARDFIRREMGCNALVVGTQGYGPTGLSAQEGMDFIDTHAYWQHPHFPRRAWDPGDWTIGRKAMVEEPDHATFLNLAAHRVPGRPFTVSEYNHPAPNDFQVECVPMIAAVAALEDWDGVWFYTFEHNNDRWSEGLMGSFFDFRANPAKWAFMPAGAALFRDGGIGPVGGSFLSTLVPPDAEATWADPAAALERHRFNHGGKGKSGKELARLLYHNSGSGGAGSGACFLGGSGGWVAVGRSAAIERETSGRLRIEAPGFCAVMLAAKDARGMEECRSMLVTVCGRAENRGMRFNKDRSSVGREWGKPPVRAEAVRGELRLPAGNWKAWTLKPDGSRGKKITVGRKDGSPVLRLSPEHGTLCYWLER